MLTENFSGRLLFFALLSYHFPHFTIVAAQ